MGIKPRSGDNNWNPATIRDILANPVNDGKVIWNRRKSRKMLIDGEIIKSRPVAPEYICVAVSYTHLLYQ